VIHKGRIDLDSEVQLPEGTPVEVSVRPNGDATPPINSGQATLYDRLKPFIGSAKGLRDDASENVDHHLYGAI